MKRSSRSQKYAIPSSFGSLFSTNISSTTSPLSKLKQFLDPPSSAASMNSFSPRIAHRHVLQASQYESQLRFCLRLPVFRRSILPDIRFDPSLVWNPDINGHRNQNQKCPDKITLSSLIIGTSMFSETSSATSRCSRHGSSWNASDLHLTNDSNVPYFFIPDTNCVSCVRHALHVSASMLFNHIFMYNSLSISPSDSILSSPAVSEILKHTTFSSKEELHSEMMLRGTNLLSGSGWLWLVYNPHRIQGKPNTRDSQLRGAIEVLTTSGYQCVLSLGMWPLFVLDISEHMWFNTLDYGNDATTQEEEKEAATFRASIKLSYPPWSRNARRMKKGVAPVPIGDLSTPDDICKHSHYAFNYQRTHYLHSILQHADLSNHALRQLNHCILWETKAWDTQLIAWDEIVQAAVKESDERQRGHVKHVDDSLTKEEGIDMEISSSESDSSTSAEVIEVVSTKDLQGALSLSGTGDDKGLTSSNPSDSVTAAVQTAINAIESMEGGTGMTETSTETQFSSSKTSEFDTQENMAPEHTNGTKDTTDFEVVQQSSTPSPQADSEDVESPDDAVIRSVLFGDSLSSDLDNVPRIQQLQPVAAVDLRALNPVDSTTDQTQGSQPLSESFIFLDDDVPVDNTSESELGIFDAALTFQKDHIRHISAPNDKHHIHPRNIDQSQNHQVRKESQSLEEELLDETEELEGKKTSPQDSDVSLRNKD